jgi:hypothetical protein
VHMRKQKGGFPYFSAASPYVPHLILIIWALQTITNELPEKTIASAETVIEIGNSTGTLALQDTVFSNTSSQREINRITHDVMTSNKMIPSSELALESIPFAIGSSTKVYRATYSKQIVAAKVQTVEGYTPEQLRNIIGKFETELGLLCQLSHPNILSGWGACTDSPGALILVMEYAKVFVVRCFLAIRAL